MTQKTLSEHALAVIQQYLHLPLNSETDVKTPYYNNRRQQVRAALRVFVGKGSVTDITQEIALIALREKVDLNSLTAEELSKFLVEHNIGIDCSGLVYHVLDAETHALLHKSFKKFLRFPFTSGVRRIITFLRPAENTSVKSLYHESNSREISLKDIAPADALFLLEAGSGATRDHILLFHEVQYDAAGTPTEIGYTHSFQSQQDGKYGHGIKQGIIQITDIQKPIIAQTWIEADKRDADNPTFAHAKAAKTISIRRFNCFS